MTTEIEKRYEERKQIKKETKITILIGLAMMGSMAIFALAAYFIKTKPVLEGDALKNTYDMLNLIVIVLMVVILGIRRSIYYSPRFVKEEFNLTQVLQKWRSIDILLMAVAEAIPICGLIITFMGMPFERTFHFFLGGALLMVILIPVGIKVRSKLSILRKTHTNL
jgi:F0F1-type ATP synthase membrane subunit c/vacuolar-type H+-ATPase subunit K